MAQVTFYDPRTTTTYVWPDNPPFDGEQPSTKERQIDRTSNTANVGSVKQQGDDGPYLIDWKVNVFSAAHESAMWAWWQKCKSQTIWLTDAGGEVYEGQIIFLSRQRQGVIAGPKDSTDRRFYVVYEFKFEVYRFVSGLMHDAGVTP